MERLLAVLNVFSRIALIFGLMLLLPIGVSWWIGDGVLTAFDEAFFGTMATGRFLLLATQRFRRELRANDGVLLVVMCWTLLPLIAALPLLLGIPGLGFADAYFEAVSGLTATGATVLSGLDKLPPRSTCGAPSFTGSAASASSCWQWPSCRCWASAAAS